jgi:hypothetical protein
VNNLRIKSKSDDEKKVHKKRNRGLNFHFILFLFVETGEQIKNEDENICTTKQKGIEKIIPRG